MQGLYVFYLGPVMQYWVTTDIYNKNINTCTHLPSPQFPWIMHNQLWFNFLSDKLERRKCKTNLNLKLEMNFVQGLWSIYSSYWYQLFLPFGCNIPPSPLIPGTLWTAVEYSLMLLAYPETRKYEGEKEKLRNIHPIRIDVNMDEKFSLLTRLDATLFKWAWIWK